MPVLDLLLFAVILVAGFTRALEARRSLTPCLLPARQLAGILRSSDLLVAEWDPVSLLYASFWANGAKRFDVPTSATGHGPETILLLGDEIARAMASGGRVYFLGVLDLSEATWKSFLENRCHLPYHSFDGLRRCARPVANLKCNQGEEVLWELFPGCDRQ